MKSQNTTDIVETRSVSAAGVPVAELEFLREWSIANGGGRSDAEIVRDSIAGYVKAIRAKRRRRTQRKRT